MKNIKHIVYLMLENRSFDNVLGWLYSNGQKPSRFLPVGTNPVFQGLTPNMYNPDKNNVKHYVTQIPDGVLNIPTADPNEGYSNVNNQLYGTTANPPVNQPAAMMGFYRDYASNNSDTAQIMSSYTPNAKSLFMLNWLAKTFAVSDAYYASVPTQTNCNRAFAATGNSIGTLGGISTGMVDNHWDGYYPWDPYEFTQPTIWNVLQNYGYNTPDDWTIYYSQLWPGHSLGDYCFTQDLFWPNLSGLSNHFSDISNFFKQAASGTLPAFSFLEPAWFEEEWGIGANGNDYHPPADLNAGETFVFKIFNALLQSPAWANTLFIINFDEHGGTFDHMGPTWNAAAPWAKPADGTNPPQSTEYGFQFNRFGVRVPLILVSPYTKGGTVFRSPTNIPFDHASVIATILKHFNVPKSGWGLGSRVANAPTFDYVLNQSKASLDIPELNFQLNLSTIRKQYAPNDLQLMLIHRAFGRMLKQTGYSKKKFTALYRKHFKGIKTLAELKKAANKIMAELRKTKPLVVGKATPPKAVVKPKKRSAAKAVAKKRHAFKPGRKR